MPAAPVPMSCEVTHLETRDNQPASVMCVIGGIDLTTVGDLRYKGSWSVRFTRDCALLLRRVEV